MKIPEVLLFNKPILLVLFLLIAGCGQGQKDIPAGTADGRAVGDTIIFGTIGEPSTLLPVLASDSASSSVNGMVYSGLVKYDKEFNVVADMAESWEVSDDGRTIRFHLRRDVRWHDGQPFTSADVLFTYQLYIDPKIPTAYADRYLQVSRAEAPDPYTFIVHYDQPLAAALISWGVEILPRHLLEGQDVTRSPLARQPVGTGPYRFVDWRPGERVVLEANPDYFAGAPQIHRVLFRIVPDPTTMFLELRSEGLDMMDLSPLQYRRQTDTPAFRRDFRKYRYPASAYTYLGYNLHRPLFQDRRVRQALAHAIDEQELIDGVLLGLGQIATGPYKPGSWPYNPAVDTYPYDPAKARALLAEAGWTDLGSDGILIKDGRRFSFTVITNQGNDQRIKTGEILQQRFRALGIEVQLRVLEWATFLKEFINVGNFDACILGWTIPPDPDGYNVWHSSKTGPGELNFIGFKNAEVDELLERGRRTLDQEERKRYYDRLQEILAEEQPYAFLYVPDALPVVHGRFHGIEAAPAGIMHNFEKWFVPPAEQRYTR